MSLDWHPQAGISMPILMKVSMKKKAPPLHVTRRFPLPISMMGHLTATGSRVRYPG